MIGSASPSREYHPLIDHIFVRCSSPAKESISFHASHPVGSRSILTSLMSPQQICSHAKITCTLDPTVRISGMASELLTSPVSSSLIFLSDELGYHFHKVRLVTRWCRDICVTHVQSTVSKTPMPGQISSRYYILIR